MFIFNIKGDNFTADHYIKENELPIELHTHDFIELIYMINVDGSYFVDDKEFKLKQRDLIITPPATHHRIDFNNINNKYERIRLSVYPELLENIEVKKILKNIQVVNCAEQKTISDIFKKLDYYYKNFNETEFKTLVELLIKEIFLNLTLLENENNAEPVFLSPILSQAIEYINKNLFEIQSVSEISNALYITESYLFDIFKTQLRTSPKKYITSKRLHAAQKQILLGSKPTEIFQDLGFNDYATFYRSYNKMFGHPPSQEKDYMFSNDKLQY